METRDTTATALAGSGDAVAADVTTPERTSLGGNSSSPWARIRRSKALALIAVLAAGVLIFFPALRSPFLLDDYLHASMADGNYPAPRGRFDLYDFVSNADRSQLADRGLFPWWSHPQLTIRFFRPLSSALLWTEHRAFGRRPLLLHLASFAWWTIAVLAARALFRRAFSERIALIATIVFALAPCHVIPLAWLANSEVLITLAFGTLALLAQVRWRESRRPLDAALATVLFAMSMLAGEYGFAFGGYVLAMELVRRRERPLRRVLALVPFALPALLYLIARAKLGYGAIGSGFYADPLREPMVFITAAPWRIVALVANAWLTMDAETAVSPAGRWSYAVLVVIAAFALHGPLRRAMARLEKAPRQTAQWLLLGSGFALIPMLAVAPSARLVGVSAIGVSALVAILLDHAWFPSPGETRGRVADLTGPVALLIGFAHLVHGPGTSWLAGRRLRQTAVDFAANVAQLRNEIPDPANATVTVIRGGGVSFFAPFAIDPHGRPPARWRVLALTGHVLLLRVDANTIELLSPHEQGVFLADQNNLFRGPDAPLHAGDVIDVAGMHVTVVDANEHGPRDVLFHFDRELESPDLIWLAEDRTGFRVLQLPQPGFGMPLDP